MARAGAGSVLVVDLAVDVRDHAHPAAAIAMLQVQDVVRRPVKVIGDEGYLLVDLGEGVAYDSPDWPDSPVPLTRLMML